MKKIFKMHKLWLENTMIIHGEKEENIAVKLATEYGLPQKATAAATVVAFKLTDVTLLPPRL